MRRERVGASGERGGASSERGGASGSAQATPRKRWPVVKRSRSSKAARPARPSRAKARRSAAVMSDGTTIRPPTPAATSSLRCPQRLVTPSVEDARLAGSDEHRKGVAPGVGQRERDRRRRRPASPARRRGPRQPQRVAAHEHLLAAEDQRLDDERLPERSGPGAAGPPPPLPRRPAPAARRTRSSRVCSAELSTPRRRAGGRAASSDPASGYSR